MTATFPKNLNSLKWILPLSLVIGYFITLKYFQWSETASLRYFYYSLLLCGACALVLTNTNLTEKNSVAVCFALFIFFVVYFWRFYWITIDASPVQGMLPYNPYLHMVASRAQLLQAFELSVLAFAAFSVSATVLLRLARSRLCKPLNSEAGEFSINEAIYRGVLSAVILAMFALGYLTYVFHIGEMGAAPSATLPFRIFGIVFYARTIVIPLTLVLVISLADRQEYFFESRLAIVLLMFHGVTDMLLRNSRSSLLLALLLLLFLIMIGGLRAKRSEKILGSAILGASIFLVPFMTLYRRMRAQFDMSYIDALLAAATAFSNEWLIQTFWGVKFILFRMPGIESVWGMISSSSMPVGSRGFEAIFSKNGVSGYLTYVIYPLKETDNTLLAPGFVGWLYLVGGELLVVAGSLLIAVLCVWVWRNLDLDYLRCSAVAKVFFLWVLLLTLTEGTIDSLLYMVLVGLATLFAMEVGLKIISSRRLN